MAKERLSASPHQSLLSIPYKDSAPNVAVVAYRAHERNAGADDAILDDDIYTLIENDILRNLSYFSRLLSSAGAMYKQPALDRLDETVMAKAAVNDPDWALETMWKPVPVFKDERKTGSRSWLWANRKLVAQAKVVNNPNYGATLFTYIRPSMMPDEKLQWLSSQLTWNVSFLRIYASRPSNSLIFVFDARVTVLP